MSLTAYGSIFTKRAEAEDKSPLAILDQWINRTHFADVPVLIIDQERAPRFFPTHLADYVDRRLQYRERNHGHFERGFLQSLFNETARPQDQVQRLRRFFSNNAKSIVESLSRVTGMDDVSMPMAYTDRAMLDWKFSHHQNPAEYEAAHAGIVIAPPRDMKPLDLLNIARVGVGDAVIDAPEGEMSFFILAHELAHVAGADECRADLLAGMLTRKHWPDSIIPQVIADSRAVHSMITAVRAATPDHPHHEDMKKNLLTYGWSMVEAGDHAALVHGEKLAERSEETILNLRFATNFYDHTPHMLGLGEYLSKALKDDITTAPHSLEIAAQAAKFMRTHGYDEADDTMKMLINRYGHAVDRLQKGTGAYKAPDVKLF